MTSLRFTVAAITLVLSASFAPAADPTPEDPLDAALPNPALKLPARDDARIAFVPRTSPEWAGLKAYWNEASERITDPADGKAYTRRLVKIKVPLGLAAAPPVPASNPMTVAKWELGKRLFYDKVLSTTGTVACASCHDPKKGFGDRRAVSVGINGLEGGISAPTVINSAFNKLQFWDGRATELEDQAQGPVGNAKEMFGGKGEPWEDTIRRVRKMPEYVRQFQQVFGHAPTRDAAAKAIAAYERTVLVGDAVYDRAEAAMRKRVTDAEETKYETKPEDYAKVLKEAFAAKDANALAALGLDPAADAGKADAFGKRLANGRALFFGKARCSTCHAGDNFTDYAFHNLGVGAKDGVLPLTEYGRYAALPTGQKDVAAVGAFKTSALRGLLDTAPYLHDGSEKTLDEVVEFYDRGGNVNEYLDPKMRDGDAEAAFWKAKLAGQAPELPKPGMVGRDGRAVIPFQLKLSKDEKADLVLFLKGLQSAPVDATVADPKWFPAKQ